ncbi:zinc knuckle CX2CX4HX4C containing protein [Tanacetum coccineum]
MLSAVICFVYGSSKGYNEGEELLRSIASRINKMTSKGDAGVSLPRTPVRGSQNPNLELDYIRVSEVPIIVHIDALHSEGSSWLINGTNVETLFGVKFTSQSDIEVFSMSIKEGMYADILSMMTSADIDAAVNAIVTIGKKFQVDVSKSSPLVSPSTTINVPCKLNSIDVAVTFRVPLSTVGNLYTLINDTEAGKHDELLSDMTNNDRIEIVDALGFICNSIQANCNNAYVIPCKVSHADDSINLNVDESIIPSDPIAQAVDMNTKSTSYVGAAVVEKVSTRFEHNLYGYFIGKRMAFLVVEYYARNNWAKHGLKRIMKNSKGFIFFKFDSRAGLEAILECGPWLICNSPIILKKWSMDTRLLKEELTLISIWVKLHDVPIQVFEEDEADLVDVVTIGIPSLYEDGFTKETIRVDPPIVTTSNVVTPTVEKTNDGFQTVGKKKKRKGKSKSTNGGPFAGPSVKQNVGYKPKANTSAPKKGVTNVGNTSQSPSMLKMTGKSIKKDNLSMSNSFFALNNEEEDVENRGNLLPKKQILDSKGVIPSMKVVDAKKSIQNMADYSQKWHNGTSTRTRSTDTSNGLATIQAQLNNLGREIKKVNERVYDAQVPFPQGGRYRAAASGFYQRDNGYPSYQERRQTMEESLSKFMAEYAKRHDENSKLIKEIRAKMDVAIRNQGASIKALEIQIGQIGKGIAENVLVGIDKFVFPVDFIVLDFPEDIKVSLILGRPFLSTAHAKIDVFKRKITLQVGDDKIVFKSDKATSNIIKRVYALRLRERMELDLEARLTAKALILNRSLDLTYGDYIELNDLNKPLELRRNQVEDLGPTIEDGEVIDEPMEDIVKTRNDNDKISNGIDECTSFCDVDRKIHIDCAFNLQFACMIVIENMDAYRDEGMGDVILGKLFCREIYGKAKRFDRMNTIYNGNNIVTYQIVATHLKV